MSPARDGSMGDLLTPGLLDAILAAVALELAALGALLARAGRARLFPLLLGYLASGAFLLLALRASLAASDPAWIALALLASLFTHVVVLWQAYRTLTRPSLAAGSSDPRIAGP